MQGFDYRQSGLFQIDLFDVRVKSTGLLNRARIQFSEAWLIKDIVVVAVDVVVVAAVVG